jgi:hypothetical protein
MPVLIEVKRTSYARDSALAANLIRNTVLGHYPPWFTPPIASRKKVLEMRFVASRRNVLEEVGEK